MNMRQFKTMIFQRSTYSSLVYKFKFIIFVIKIVIWDGWTDEHIIFVEQKLTN